MRLGSPVALLGRPRFLSRNVTLFVLDCSVFKFHLMSGGSCQHPIPILFYSVSFITCSLHINAEFRNISECDVGREDWFPFPS